MADETPVTQPDTTQPEPVSQNQRKPGAPDRKTIITATSTLIAGLILGMIGGYALQAPKLTEARADYDRVRASYTEANDRLQAQNDTISGLREQVNDLEQQVEELTPTTEAGPGLTVLERNITSRYGSKVVDYVVRNDTNKTFDSISLNFRYLDKDGNTVVGDAWTNNASVEPGKTGIVTAHVTVETDQYPTITGIQCEGGWVEIAGKSYDISLSDEPVVNL